MSELELRRQAMVWLGEGVGPSEVADRLGRSRQWVSKWRARWDTDGEDGLRDRSRRPRSSPTALDDRVTDRVLEVRSKLEADPQAGVSGLEILSVLERERFEPLPSVRSIERILQRAGVTRPTKHAPKNRTGRIVPRVTVPGFWQQSDWIQDRYLQGGIRFNSLQVVDAGCDAVASGQYVQRTILNAATFLIEDAWPLLSIPHVMSIDGAFTNTTHRYNPWTLWTKLCLLFGVELMISPPGELGWTNRVEHINHLWQARTIRAERYETLDQLRTASQRAIDHLNHRRPLHDPTMYGSRYPIDVLHSYQPLLRWPPTMILSDYQDRKGTIHLPLTAGQVTFLTRATNNTIRFTKTTWPIRDTIPEGALITATITTADQTLTLRYRDQPFATHHYPIRHPVQDPYYPPAPRSISTYLTAMGTMPRRP